MGRSVSANMTTILAGAERKIDCTIEITFPDASYFRYATAPLTIGPKTYTNDLESVREIRQTLEAPVDRLAVALQNKDRVLSLDIAANYPKWRKAEAVIGRYYRGGTNLATTEWVEMFRGAVQQPKADDQQVTFEVIHDVLAPGQIICNTTLDPMCPNVFKDPDTCGYTGLLTACDHHLKSKGGCDGRSNSEHFRGMEHRYNPDTAIPGTGGNDPDPDPGGSGPCPRIDQFVNVKGPDGCRMSQMVALVTEDDWIWHPVQNRFRKIRSATVVKNQPIWEILAFNGALGFSSHPHPVIPYCEHVTGLPVRDFVPGDPMLTVISGQLRDSKAALSRDTGETADVVRIEIDADRDEDKIYCWGDSPDKQIACHNLKPEN